MKRGREVESAETAAVAEHYSSRPNVGPAARGESAIASLRGFNNWVKSALLGLFCTRPNLRVLDLAGGKGGDLAKWRALGIGHLVLADAATGSVVHARERFVAGRFRFPALFVAADCFGTRLFAETDEALRFDLVSCQFAFHYAFESEARLRMALSNVTERLEPGGHFCGTVPNASRLVRLVRQARGLDWANGICGLQFDAATDKDAFPEFGARYTFTLAESVDRVPEFLVHFAVLVRVAAEYGLELVLHQEFPDFFAQYGQDPRFSDLLRVMRGDSLSLDEWQAASLYVVFCFRKKGDMQQQQSSDSGVVRYNLDYERVLEL